MAARCRRGGGGRGGEVPGLDERHEQLLRVGLVADREPDATDVIVRRIVVLVVAVRRSGHLVQPRIDSAQPRATTHPAS